MGSTGQALRAGKPQLVTPFCNDQFDIAQRLCRLGVARALKAEGVSVNQLTHNIEILLSSPGYTECAKAVAEDVAMEDGASSAAALISDRLRGAGRG
jgi:UDP:flavonoid glycosyltransferase YjiC (YdhE family)